MRWLALASCMSRCACTSIARGRSAIDAVSIVGNRAVSSDDLEAKIATAPTPKPLGLFRASSSITASTTRRPRHERSRPRCARPRHAGRARGAPVASFARSISTRRRARGSVSARPLRQRIGDVSLAMKLDVPSLHVTLVTLPEETQRSLTLSSDPPHTQRRDRRAPRLRRHGRPDAVDGQRGRSTRRWLSSRTSTSRRASTRPARPHGLRSRCKSRTRSGRKWRTCSGCRRRAPRRTARG